MRVIYEWPIWVTMVAILVPSLVASEVGFRIRLNRPDEESDRAHNVIIAIKASIIGFVALLLGFSFSITSSRYSERLRLVLNEANAIGTCYLRAGLLTEPEQGAIRAALRQYTDLCLESYRVALNPVARGRALKAMQAELDTLWQGVDLATRKNPSLVIATQVVPAANAVIDLSATYIWASRNQMPPAVIVLLGVTIVIAGALIGSSFAETGRRHLGLWLALNGLVMLVVLVILDFDRPRRGFIQIDHAPLVEVRENMKT